MQVKKSNAFILKLHVFIYRSVGKAEIWHRMEQIHSIEKFTATFSGKYPVSAFLTENTRFTQISNILFFCIAVVQNACLIAQYNIEEGRDFIKSLYQEIVPILTISPENLSDAFDQLSKTKPEDLTTALKYFQSLGRFVKMRTKKIPSAETISLLFMANCLNKDNILCSQTIFDFLKQMKITVSYDHLCKISVKNWTSLKSFSKSQNYLSSSKLPTICLRRTPVHSPPSE